MPPPPVIHHHPKILQIPMQNIVVYYCAKYQGNPANISKEISHFYLIVIQFYFVILEDKL